MIFSRAWFALMRRNFIYRRRNWIGSILELVFPMSFVGVLIAIKNAYENAGNSLLPDVVPAIYPSDTFASFQPLTFRDYVTAIQAKRTCRARGGDGTFVITGIANHGENWPIPLVKCNSYSCQYDGQDATPFCEYGAIAVAPLHADDYGGYARGMDFESWLYDQYPALRTDQEHLDFPFVQRFDSSDAIDSYISSHMYGLQAPKIIMGIIFEGNETSQYVYRLRQNSTNFNAPEAARRPATLTTPDTARKFKDFAKNDYTVCVPIDSTPRLGFLGRSCTGQYMYNGVLTFQRLVGDYILNRTGAADVGYRVAEAGVQFAQFPTPEYEMKGFYASIKDVGPLLVTLGMLYPVAAMISYIAREKELRQKELMKMMSVTESDIGWSWFITFFLFNLVTTLTTTLVSTKLYLKSEFRYLLAFWFLTFNAITVFAMMAATYTSKSARAVLIGLLKFFIGVFMTIAIPLDYREANKAYIAMISLHPVAAFSYGLQEIGRLEDQGTGVQTNTATITDNASGYVFQDTLRYLLLDCVVWGFATWYLNRVIEPDYGQALPVWFPLLPSYWFPTWCAPRNTNIEFDLASRSNLDHDEEEDEDIPLEPVGDSFKRQAEEGKSIEIYGLRKIFGETIAVDGLNFSMYNGQITALLGHNGAGKTTTINMLTGAIAPSDGYAIVAGKDIRTQMDQIRQDIGICPQHDCLFPQLTVREHVQFFARLKGLYTKMSYEKAEEQIDQSLRDVALMEKRFTLSKNLSGGMKRKLSVAIAFCGGSQVVLLDEPTSGMDPFARRFTWNVIRHYRQDRCIILTTHFMDEADILGDRIAIMAEGQLRCAGSSLFLKKTYGVGYQLTIEKQRQGDSNKNTPNRRILMEKEDSGEITVRRVDTHDDGDIAVAEGPLSLNGKAVGVNYKNPQDARDVETASQDGAITPPKIRSFKIQEDDSSHEVEIISLASNDEAMDAAYVGGTPATPSTPFRAENFHDARPDRSMEQYRKYSPGDQKLIEVVKSSVRSATLLSNVGTEMSFQLPIGASAQFAPMFEGLDMEVEKGTITSYGVSITTLDEVFLLVARGNVGNKSVRSFRSVMDESKKNHTVPNQIQEVVEERSEQQSMNLEKDGLFIRHIGALFKKRAAYFRRDKKAWLCTTILPSLFVCLGFLLFTFAAPSRNLKPLVLDLNDYNRRASPSPKNPITYNAPGSNFTCQPAGCMYKTAKVENDDEVYYFCGLKGKPDEKRLKCSVTESESIISRITDGGAVPVGADLTSITDSSRFLLATGTGIANITYAASLYGAILFTRDTSSITFDGNESLSYNEMARETCLSKPANYWSDDECKKFEGVGYVIQYNHTALHAAPMYQTLADEALVREALDDPNFKIRCTIAPLPITTVERQFGQSEDAFSAWFLVVLSFPFISGAFASFIVTERQSKAKHLQTVAGVQPSAYWISTFLWDVLNYQIPLWIVIMLMFAFDVDVLTTSRRDVFAGVVTLLFLYGPASAGFTYCVSYAFSSPSLCNMFMIILGFLVGMGGPLTCFILTLLGSIPGEEKPNLLQVVKILTWILRFTPFFCLGKGLFHVINIDVYSFFEEDMHLSAFTEPILLYEVFFLAAQVVAYMTLTILLDIWSSNPHALSIWHGFISIMSLDPIFKRGVSDGFQITMALPDDNDVLEEQKRVLSGEAEDDLIVIRQLTKVYNNGKVAVNNLSLGIPPGECFGLLGINGAGKTTAMGMLTAEFPPTTGDAILAGYSVSRDPEKTRRRIGYCPQFDAHFANLTGREHVELYASIKGVPSRYVKEAAASKLAEVGLSRTDSDRLSAGYSGGMKRRLSLACATIGQPQIVFLDECSTGVDPVARREIWQLISNMVSRDNVPLEERTSVILTTHSMEECEALCPRIGIMATGRLRCLGSAQHLKNKFGQGYQVELKVRIVERRDRDFLDISNRLAERVGQRIYISRGDDNEDIASNLTEDWPFIYFTLEETLEALTELGGNAQQLAVMINESDPSGYPIWKDATSDTGVTLEALAAFVTTELRIMEVQKFMNEFYPKHILRERQDTKVRYEVKSEGIRISHIFANIEAKKDDLRLADYGVSQTSLEQVFNMHAAEAERLKEGRNDG